MFHLEKEIFSGYRIDALAYSEGAALFTVRSPFFSFFQWFVRYKETQHVQVLRKWGLVCLSKERMF